MIKIVNVRDAIIDIICKFIEVIRELRNRNSGVEITEFWSQGSCIWNKDWGLGIKGLGLKGLERRDKVIRDQNFKDQTIG